MLTVLCKLGLVCNYTPDGEAEAMETNKHFQIKQLSEKKTRWFNESIILAARKEVYADFLSTPFDKLVKSHKGSEQTFQVG